MTYIENRIRPRIAWYDKRAVMSKRIKLAVDVGTALLSIALVLLLHIETFSRLGLSIIAAVIAAMLALEKIGAFGERWLLYRLAAEALQAEVELFTYRAGPYAAGQGDAERLLVERTERLLQQEAGRWRELGPKGEMSLRA